MKFCSAFSNLNFIVLESILCFLFVTSLAHAANDGWHAAYDLNSASCYSTKASACSNWKYVSPADVIAGPFYEPNSCRTCQDGIRLGTYQCVGVIYLSACNLSCPSGQYRFGAGCKQLPSPKNLGGPLCNASAGNPIHIGIGNKFQKEIDLPSIGDGSLNFYRSYNNLKWSESPTFGQRWGNSWNGSFDRGVKSDGLTKATIYRPDGKEQLFTYSASNSKWQSEADEASILMQLSSNAGWTFNDAATEETELYDNAGKLLKIIARDGYAQTLIYTNTTTNVDNALDINGNPTSTQLPVGLLLRVEDSHGRILKFGYNLQRNVVKMTDANGGIFRYVYDVLTTANTGNLLSVIYPDNKTRTYVYNESANTSGTNLPNALTGIIDENGNRFATWKYDVQGRAISSEHNLPNNQIVEKVSIVYTTDSSGNVTSAAVNDALDSSRTYSFSNVLGVVKNTGVTQPCTSGCGATSATTYDANGNISSKTDFNGNITNYVYDLTRNLETSRTEAYGTPQARTITTQWHATYRLPTLITEPGKTNAFGYDASGNLLTKTTTDTALSKSRTWTWTYNSLGQVLTADGPRTDVLDKTTNTYYTSASSTAGSVHSIGDLATVTNAAGQVTSITNYDLNGRPLSITDPNGVVTTLTYDPRGRLKTRIVAGTQTTTYDYDGVGQLTKVTLPDTSFLSYTYDTAHRLTDITDKAGNTTHYTLDAMGNRTKEDTKDPSSNILKTRSRVFDALNRLQKDIGGTSPTTQITQYDYDNNGNLKNITDPLNHITVNGYDALNRLITVTDPANGVATTTYNALDQVTQVKDPRLVATNYTIDALGNVTLTQSPDSGNTQTVYDAAGNATQKTDARGIVSNYTYDALNRITAITYPASTTENVSFTYDSTANGNKGAGRLTGYSNDGGATVLVYDSFGNITTQTEQIGSQFYVTSYLYDTANRISQVTYPSDRRVIYTRNTLGQVTQVQTKDTSAAAAVSIISNATYEPFGPIKTLTYGNAVTSTLLHDADYRVSRITTTSTPNWDFIYSYDAAGNLTGLADQVSTFSKTYGYDNLDRVTSDVNNTGTWTYQYDANGNRTKRINSSTQTLTFAASSNRIAKIGTANQTLDAVGNLTASGTKTFTYNNANRLSLVSNSGTATAQPTYNALNQRTQKLQIAKPFSYHYGQNNELLGITVRYPSGTLYQRVEYLWLEGMTPLAQVRTTYNSNGTVASRRTTYIHADHLNTPRLMTDSTKAMVWRWDGDAYGQTAPNENPDGDGTTDTLSLRFPGQIADSESGFYYNVNRDYDPATGRYVQSDPIGLNGSLNTYAYVDGNPISLIDPLGLKKVIFLPPGDPSRQAAENAPDDPAVCLVISHGSAKSVNGMNAGQLNRALNKAGCEPKQPVKLEACNAGRGDNSIAEQLAKIRDSSVVAPDDRVWTTPWDTTMGTPYPPFSEDKKSFWNTVPNVGKPGNWRAF